MDDRRALIAAIGGLLFVIQSAAFCFGHGFLLGRAGGYGGVFVLGPLGLVLILGLLAGSLACGGDAAVRGRRGVRVLGIAIVLLAFASPVGGCAAGFDLAAQRGTTGGSAP